MRLIILFLPLYIISITPYAATAQEQIDKVYGTVTDSIYFYEPLGWKVIIPSEAELMSSKLRQYLTDRGNKTAEEVMDVDMAEVEEYKKSLLSYTIRKKESFTAVVEPMEVTKKQFIKNVQYLADVIKKGYEHNGYIVETKAYEQDIRSRKFMVITVDAYADEEKVHPVVKQGVYITQIFDNKEILSVVISYLDEETHAIMYRSFENSITTLK